MERRVRSVRDPQQPKLTAGQRAAIHRTQSKHLQGVPLGKKAVMTSSGIKYVDRTDYVPETDAPAELAEPAKPKRQPKPRAMIPSRRPRPGSCGTDGWNTSIPARACWRARGSTT